MILKYEKELSELKKELADICLKYDLELEKAKFKIKDRVSSIACYKQEIHNYSNLKLKEVAPYIEKLLAHYEKDNYIFHKATLEISEGHTENGMIIDARLPQFSKA